MTEQLSPVKEYFDHMHEQRAANEIPPGTQTSFRLPLEQGFTGLGFQRCPAGIAVTSDRLWFVHYPFSEGTKTTDFWPDWKDHVQEEPLMVVAFGREERNGIISPRIRNLVEALKLKEHIENVSIYTLPITGEGIYEVTMHQEDKTVILTFVEVWRPENVISLKVSIPEI